MITTHLDVCPECGEVANGHTMDPPNLCRHSRELYVPVPFIAVGGDDFTELADETYRRLNGFGIGTTKDQIKAVLWAALADTGAFKETEA